MLKRKGNVAETIGKTDLVELGRLCSNLSLRGSIFLKLEFQNPGLSKKGDCPLLFLPFTSQ